MEAELSQRVDKGRSTQTRTAQGGDGGGGGLLPPRSQYASYA